MATTAIPPPPTWMDMYNKLSASNNNFGGKGVNAWNQDQAHMAQKDELDHWYKSDLEKYNQQYGTNHQVDQSVLGYDAQPGNAFHSPTDNVDQRGGVMGEALGKDWVSNGAKLAALAAAGYFGGNALGLWGGGSGAAAGAGAAGTSGGLGSMYGVGTGATGSAAMGGATGITLGSPVALGSTAGIAPTMIGGAGLAGTAAGGITLAEPIALGSSAGVTPNMIGGATGAASTLGTVRDVVGTARGISGLVKDAGSLYSAYTANRDARENQQVIKDQMTTLNDMYKEGSPWAEQLKEQLARKDAAAGRNSQYGPRLAQYQALLADKAGQNAGVLGNLAKESNAAAQNSNQYQNLMLNRLTGLADSTGLTKKIDNYVNQGVQNVWDSFFGDD